MPIEPSLDEIVSLNVADLDIQELERRLELSLMSPGTLGCGCHCGTNVCNCHCCGTNGSCCGSNCNTLCSSNGGGGCARLC